MTESDYRAWSYAALAAAVGRASDDPADDLRRLFARMAFNALVSNSDDHPRNHAMVRHGGGWTLSPAYDLVPNPQVSVEARYLAMACGPEGRLATAANLVAGSADFGMGRDEAEAAVRTMLAAVGAQWEAVARECGVSASDRASIAGAFAYSGLARG